MSINMKKQWGKELRDLEKQKKQADKDCVKEMRRIAREITKLNRANIQANNVAVRRTRKLDRRIAIVEARLGS